MADWVTSWMSPAAGDEKWIGKISLEWWLKNRGLPAEGSLKAAGYSPWPVPLRSWPLGDDRVWEVRVLYLHTGGPTAILWMNDKTEKVIALGAEKKGRNRTGRPSERGFAPSLIFIV